MIDYSKRHNGRETVTAAMAVEMLSRNHDNRALSPKSVRTKTEKMLRLKALRAKLKREPTDDEIVEVDAWLYTHQGFGFDRNGVLTDGQHRLAAQIRADITLDWNITTGLAPEAFDRTDVGDMRSATDLLSRRCPDLKNKSLAAAAARMALTGLHLHDVDKVTVVDFTEHYEDMISGFCVEMKKNPVTARSPVVGAFVAAARRLDEWDGPHGLRHLDLLMVTAERLAKQEWLPNRKDDPLKTLHTRLVADERQALKSGKVSDAKQVYSLTVATIRAELAGRGKQVAQATDIDWGDPTDQIREGTGDLGARRAMAAKLGHLKRRIEVVKAEEEKRPATVVRAAVKK